MNFLLTSVADLLLAPFRNYPAIGLVCWSVVTGVVMAFVIGKTSNQRALRRVADNIRAQLLAIKLFKEDLIVTFQCQTSLLKWTGLRLLHSLPPMLVMAVPLLLILTQLAMRYEFQPLIPGERAVVAMHIKPEHWKEMRDITLVSGKRFVVETESLRDEQTTTIYWRVRATGSESEPLLWHSDGMSISKQLAMSPDHYRLLISNPRRPGNSSGTGGSLWDRVSFPAEDSIPASSPIESIDIQLTQRVTPIFGWTIPWWATFFLVSMGTAFASGKFMGVQF